ncbi:MAG: TspO/MBR family protein [Candidatus Paceibacterota bacterium]|jgi:tryptophan-rich sensory protein
MHINKVSKLIIAIIISELAGIIGAVFTTPSIATWYATLAKPALNPPAWVFGPVWTALYALIGVSLFLVWNNDWRVVNVLSVGSHKAWNKLSQRLWTGDLQKVNIVALFWVQWTLNVAWSILFFGLHSPGAALFEIAVLWISIVYVMINFWRVSKAAAWLLVPYILWVTFAGYLNFSIWYLSPHVSGSVACTQEAKLCPDGSAVERTGPDCAFALCPSTATGTSYTNSQYRFSFALPISWEGYSIVTSTWKGDAIGPSGDTPVATGPTISIRSPQWTAAQPMQDIPIMIFTPVQWSALQSDAFHIGAAPIGPSVLASSTAYVFALPARYNFAFLSNYQEVEDILAGHPLRVF